MERTYRYVGPEEIRARSPSSPAGRRIGSPDDLLDWLDEVEAETDRMGWITLTFVVDAEGGFRVADRRSEHVACAGGGEVRSAGEISFTVEDGAPRVAEVTNQSTGYCPEPESWPAVAAALDAAGIEHPGGFTREMHFRLCPRCGEQNLVKDGWFVCALCSAELPARWNFGD